MTFTKCTSRQFGARIHTAVLTAGTDQIVNIFTMKSWHLALTPVARTCEETDKGLYSLLLITMFSRHCGILHRITQKAYKNAPYFSKNPCE